MKKQFLALVMAFALLIPTSALASPKPGASCSKSGSTTTYSGKKYTCVKSGKKLVWNKGVAIPKPIPTPTPTATPTPSPSPTVVKTKNLAQPDFLNQVKKPKDLKVVITLKVPDNADGAFVASPQMGIEPLSSIWN